MKNRGLFSCFIVLFVCFATFVGGLIGAGTVIYFNPYISNGKIVSNSTVVEEESAVTKVVEQAADSVVSVIITKDLPKLEEYFFYPFGEDSGFRVPRQRQNGTEQQQVGAGTGFVASADGLIVTNRHVVSDTKASYTVLFNNGEKVEAKVLARDTIQDIAVLKIDKQGLKPLEFSDSASLKLGQRVVAIGNALGEFQNTVSAGIISGLNRTIEAAGRSGEGIERLENVIQTDASINPGNSGGPLLNYQGQVVGVNVAVAASAENIGFAIPANEVKKIVDSIIKFGEIRRPYIGVRFININATVAKERKLSVDYGALIVAGSDANETAIVKGSPAEKAGLAEGDIILEINGSKLTTNLQTVVQKYNIGDEITLKVLRGKEEQTIKLTLEQSK